MAYQVELNRLTKTSRLVYVATIHRRNIGSIGEIRRRHLNRGVARPGHPGIWDYHVTKGWRKARP